MSNIWNNNTIEDEIQRNSLEYGVAVNTDRSIPDAKSGLKPVARRIMYDAFIEGRTSNKPHVKSARIVGDVMGRFHPHGDSSIYGAMIRLSQNWVMRYPLIDSHGNNGTILGDGPAAMRYTEARLSKIAEDGLLKNLKKNTVDFTLTFDESEEEPVTLPAIFPNLLCNPNEGIGWAMGCSWAPHNLNEVAIAINDYLDGKEPMLPGPDFPTGGVVINKDDIPDIMRTGHGTVKVQGKYNIEKNNIVFYEIPYGTRVEALMEEIGKLAEEENMNGIVDIRNETGKKSGLRLVIQIEKNANIKYIVGQLFSKTNLQSTFSYNQVALVGKTPTELSLKDAIKVYVDHNTNCIVREVMFDIKKASDRLHIIIGLLKALDEIDKIIEMIKKSSSSAAAKETLKIWGYSEEQAKAILDMKLSRLAKLEKEDLEKEKEELNALLLKLEAIYENPIPTLRERLQDIVDKYGDARRTELVQISTSKEEKEIANVEPDKCVVIMTEDGYIKRVSSSKFKVQRRNGKGVKSKGEIVSTTIRTNTIDSLMVFTDAGKMYRILVDDIPETPKGLPIKALIEMEQNENPTLIYSIYRDTKAKFVLFATKGGMVKKTMLEEYIKTKKKSGIAAITLKDGDSLASVSLVSEEDLIVMTHGGMGIRFSSLDVGATGRATAGVKGITLKEDDYVIGVHPVRNPKDELAIFSENGLGKTIKITDLPLQKRAGKGLIIYKPTISSGKVSCGALVDESDSIFVAGSNNSICISASEIPTLGRASLGNQIMKGADIISATKI